MRPEEPVSRVMTETVVVIDVERPVSEVLDCFLQYPIHHLPVVRDGKLTGMLSSADVMKLEYFVPKATVDRAQFLDERMKIEQLMRSPVLCLRPHVGVGEAAERMIKAGVHAVAVVDDAERVIGILTTSDVIQGLLHGPPRKGQDGGAGAEQSPTSDTSRNMRVYRQKPAADEYRTAMRAAEALHVEERDTRYLGKTLLYLDQRRIRLEKVLELADRFLLSGQEVQVHALLLKAIHAAKRAEEHATGKARVPFPLE
jgi:CBS domain-containing membrane protein